jgi:hypothetical protein
MSQSRFCIKEFGKLQINNHTLTSDTSGTIQIDNVNIGGGGSGNMTFTPSFTPDSLQFCVLQDSTGNAVTNSYGLNAHVGKGFIDGFVSYDNNVELVLGSVIASFTNNSGSIYLNAQQGISEFSNTYITQTCQSLNHSYINHKVNMGFYEQQQSYTNAVSISNAAGTITTFQANTPTQGSSIISVSGIDVLTSDSVVQLTINNYTGQGLPSVYAKDISSDGTTGSFNLVVCNSSVSEPLNEPLTIAYNIIEPNN